MPEFLQQAVGEAAPVPLELLAFRLIVAFLVGCLVAAIHYATSPVGRRADRSFLITLVLLSLLIALVTQVIGNSLSRAFSLAGVLAIVRFRTVVEDIRDTSFVIYAVVAGMAVASDFVLAPLVCAPLVFAVAWTLRPGPGRTSGAVLVRLGLGKQPDARIEEILKRRVGSGRLTALATVRGGSAVEASYTVNLPPPEQVYALVDELSRVEGVQGVEIKEGS